MRNTLFVILSCLFLTLATPSAGAFGGTVADFLAPSNKWPNGNPLQFSDGSTIPVVPPDPPVETDPSLYPDSETLPESSDTSEVRNRASDTERVQRLIKEIRETRKEIASGEKSDYERVRQLYEARLDAIAPKDMFETTPEYNARHRREKTVVHGEWSFAHTEIKQKYDLKREKVAELLKQVETLLETAFPPGAVSVTLEDYNADREWLYYCLTVNSRLLTNTPAYNKLSQLNRKVSVTEMTRHLAKGFWQNRQHIVVKPEYQINDTTLDIRLHKLWLEVPQSEMRVAVYMADQPSTTRSCS